MGRHAQTDLGSGKTLRDRRKFPGGRIQNQGVPSPCHHLPPSVKVVDTVSTTPRGEVVTFSVDVTSEFVGVDK